MMDIRNSQDLARSVERLFAAEPRFRPLFDRHGLPPLRRMPEGLDTLLRIITDQLISVAAADAIWQRILDAHAPLTAGTILLSGEPGLCQLGLSRSKARSFLAASRSALAGHLDHRLMSNLDDDQARSHLRQIPGVGPWTAEIYLLSALGRRDAWPAGDIALQSAAADLFDLPGRPGEKDMTLLASPWRPDRSVAARYLWLHYRQRKKDGQG